MADITKKMTVIAKSAKGKEFIYKMQSIHRVPIEVEDAIYIRDFLNKKRYDLKENEVWHFQEIEQAGLPFVYAMKQSFFIQDGSIREVKRPL